MRRADRASRSDERTPAPALTLRFPLVLCLFFPPMVAVSAALTARSPWVDTTGPQLPAPATGKGLTGTTTPSPPLPPPTPPISRPTSAPTSGRLPGREPLPCQLWGVAVWGGQRAPGQMRRGPGARGQGRGPGLSDVSQQLVLTPVRRGSRLGAHTAAAPPRGSRGRQNTGAAVSGSPQIPMRLHDAVRRKDFWG